MIVRQLLSHKGRQVETVRPQTTVLAALERMAAANVGALVVTGADGRLEGIVSERDYARKVVLRGRSSHDTAVEEIMSSPVVTVPPAADVKEVMQIMTDRRLRHLPVVEDGEMIGIVSIGDVVKAVISEQEFLIDQLQSYIDLR